MALIRRSGARFTASIWPGFVDALTALLLILMFVLSIFMIVQFSLRERITGQNKKLETLGGELADRERELDQLSKQLSGLSDALGMEKTRAGNLERELGGVRATLTQTAARADQLAVQLRQRDASLDETRRELDAQSEAARLAAAKQAALEALIKDLETKNADRDQTIKTLQIDRDSALALITQLQEQDKENVQNLTQTQAALEETQGKLSEAEKLRLAEAAAARMLRQKLEENADELDATTLALEKARAEAEQTLTLLAAARMARTQLSDELKEKTTDLDREQALRKVAESALATAGEQTLREQRKTALLNAQLSEMNQQLASLQSLLDSAQAKDVQNKTEIADLEQKLNRALAQKVSELEQYRSEFFGQMRAVLGGRDDIRVVGDRFVFQSEVLFAPGSATLGASGRAELAKIGSAMRTVAARIPPQLNWILRVDGHTDSTPLRSNGRIRNNWELSQARALSVVEYLIDNEDIPPERLAATGFGEYQPIDLRPTPEGLARNRRIEFKFTER